jgi:DNA repair exonuclease SbcCD ATPase subunit
MDLEKKYNYLLAKRNICLEKIDSLDNMLRVISVEKTAQAAARAVLTEANRLTQKRVTTKIESLITLCIRSVFDRPFTFKLRIEEKRNTIEAKPVIIEGENEYDPKDEMGGGIIDIISFAFRIVLWHLSNPRPRNLFILDEPFKFTGSLVEKAGEVLRYLSKEMGFQVIMISHDNELIGICDRVYRITHNGTESKAELIKGRMVKRRNG